MSNPREIRRGRERYEVIDEIQVRRRTYPILEKLGRAGRQRYLVFDQHAGPKGDLRTLHVLPRSRHAVQQLEVLTRISESNFTVPTILECHPERDRIVVMTKWIRGTDLETYLDNARSGKTPWPTVFMAFNLFRKFAHGLCQFHQHKNFVHGDLKPENLILCQEPYQLAMIDFGSAWLEEETRRRDPGDGATHGYAAPELREPGAMLDARADQFSATVIFYEMLTGTLPYEEMGGQAGWDEFQSEFASTFVRPSKAAKTVDRLPSRIWRKLDGLVTTGLQLDPEKRFPNGRIWRDALDEIHFDLRRPAQLSRANAFVLSLIDWFRDQIRRS